MHFAALTLRRTLPRRVHGKVVTFADVHNKKVTMGVDWGDWSQLTYKKQEVCTDNEIYLLAKSWKRHNERTIGLFDLLKDGSNRFRLAINKHKRIERKIQNKNAAV